MATIQVPTSEQCRAVELLPVSKLELFAAEAFALKNESSAGGPPLTEEELLALINRSLPEDTLKRYKDLLERRRSETLTLDEQVELLQITTVFEHFDAIRLQALAALARLRKVTLRQVMDQLGVKALAYEI